MPSIERHICVVLVLIYNFRINNIEIDAQIPKIIPEFENVQIIKENSEIDEAVSNRELVFGNNKELENIVFSKANSKIRIVNNQKAENVNITYTFDEDSQVLLNQIDIVASKNIMCALFPVSKIAIINIILITKLFLLCLLMNSAINIIAPITNNIAFVE